MIIKNITEIIAFFFFFFFLIQVDVDPRRDDDASPDVVLKNDGSMVQTCNASTFF